MRVSGQDCSIHLPGGLMLADTNVRIDFLRMAQAPRPVPGDGARAHHPEGSPGPLPAPRSGAISSARCTTRSKVTSTRRASPRPTSSVPARPARRSTATRGSPASAIGRTAPITAGNSAGIHSCSYAGFIAESAEYSIYLEVNEGSYGGRFGKDAMDSVDNLMANTRNNPIEELDMRFPMRCDQYELRPEPAAPGRWRGGLGIVRRNRFLVDGTYWCEGDRQTDPPGRHLRRLGRPRRVVPQEPRHRAARRSCRPR